MSDLQKVTYQDSGVDYSKLDAMKRLAQEKAAATAPMLRQAGMQEVSASRGESAYVWDAGDHYGAMVVEGLGTKNLVADAVRKFTGKSHYDAIAQDVVGAITNDLIVVGAKPLVVSAYWGLGDSAWLADEERASDLATGWADACRKAGAAWGGGETPAHAGIVNPDTIDLGGSAVGIINPKDRLVLGNKLADGDKIVLIESNGIHCNGLTLARKIAKGLDHGYETKLPSGISYGEALLKPQPLYAQLVQDVFAAGVDIHYMVNVSGHGWRKLMRANQEFSYIMTEVPPVPEEFSFIGEQSSNDAAEMY
ncbi:MAG TPA: AIR synthase related protein, partial [Candidatus Polarisedimenticolaceae bacterium]|nr:AIR synthase related protein [Candidatus Polarisedimenticolaceae bacterium]